MQSVDFTGEIDGKVNGIDVPTNINSKTLAANCALAEIASHRCISGATLAPRGV